MIGTGSRWHLGNSVEGRPIEAYANFTRESAGAGVTLLIGATHGDERATVPLLENFIRFWLEPGKVREPTLVLPLHNPDGFARSTRYNARGVDLNRNFPHHWSRDSAEPSGDAPLSEPESRLLHDLILRYRPAKIVTLHWALAEIDPDGAQSVPLAEAMWASLSEQEKKPYRLRLPEPGKPVECPGSLGQWCGHALEYAGGARISMVTLELPYHPGFDPRPEILPGDHLETLRRLWEADPEAYLAGVEAPVHRMLAAACRFPAGIARA